MHTRIHDSIVKSIKKLDTRQMLCYRCPLVIMMVMLLVLRKLLIKRMVSWTTRNVVVFFYIYLFFSCRKKMWFKKFCFQIYNFVLSAPKEKPLFFMKKREWHLTIYLKRRQNLYLHLVRFSISLCWNTAWHIKVSMFQCI